MQTHIVTFNDIPTLLMEMKQKVDFLCDHLPCKTEQIEDRLFTIEELQNYLPEHPAKQTIYGWVNSRSIPFEKHGKRLYFRKSVIDQWLTNGRQKS